MELFRSEEDVADWAVRTGIPVGAVFSPAMLWELARRWYDDRFDLDWRRKTIAERAAILEDVGLTGAFWDLGG